MQVCQRLKRCGKPFCCSLFSSSVAFLMISVVSPKRSPSNADFSRRNSKNQLHLGQESVGDVSVLSYCSSLRNSWPKPTGVLEHYREGETNCWFSIFRGVFFPTASRRRRRMSTYFSLFTVTIPINYSRQIPGTFRSYCYVCTPSLLLHGFMQ